jgi:hypothetical protein
MWRHATEHATAEKKKFPQAGARRAWDRRPPVQTSPARPRHSKRPPTMEGHWRGHLDLEGLALKIPSTLTTLFDVIR